MCHGLWCIFRWYRMSLAKRTVAGILWKFSEQIGRRGINVLVTLLLARFLVPEEFGLVAILLAIVTIASSLMESGFKQALIRMKNAVQVDYNTAFAANLGLGAFAYGIVYGLAPVVAGYYEEPVLTVLIRVGGVTILINSFHVVQTAILSKNLNFKALLVASVPASIISGVVAVLLAYRGAGVWALVIQMILYALFATIFIWRTGGWRPAFVFSRRSFQDMFDFGFRLFIAATIDTIFRNIYVVVIAKVFSTAVAGYYFFAEKIKDLIISQLVTSIQTVTYPALSTMQDDDARLKSAYRKVVRVTAFALFPSMAFMAALADPLFKLLLPGNWAPAIPYLQLLCIASMLVPVHSVNLNILQVKGRSDLYLRLEIIKKSMLVAVLSLSLEFGITGVLLGRIITSVLSYIPNSYYSSRIINYSVKEQLGDFFPALLLSGVVGGLAYFFTIILGWPPFAELFVIGLLAAVLYIAIARVLKMEAVEHVIQLVKAHRLRDVQ